MRINKCFYCMEDIPAGSSVCPHCGRRPGEKRQPEYALPCGTILHGKYLIGAVLGQGGFGITYIGFDLLLGIKIAVKEYFPNPFAGRTMSHNVVWTDSSISRAQGCENVLKEARKMAQLRRIPEVVHVIDVVSEYNTAYIVMDFIDGITLKAMLKREGVIPCAQAVALLSPVMEAMAEVHQIGICHRDISPDNIMIDGNGEAVLLDLGAAKQVNLRPGSDLQSSQLVHKDGFSPPEQYLAGGRIGPWTDVYSICATLYYSITGKLLPPAMDRAMLKAPVDFPETVPQSLRKVLVRGLETDYTRRYQSMEELLKALQSKKIPDSPLAVHRPAAAVRANPRATPGNAKAGSAPDKRIQIAAAVCLLLILSGAVFGLTRSKKKDAEASAAPTMEAAGAKATEDGIVELSPTPLTSSLPSTEGSADSGTCGDHLTWVLDDSGTLTISGTGEMGSFASDAGTADLASDVSAVVIARGVTGICKDAFSGFYSMTNITIPSSVTSIGEYAFADCRSLTNITIPAGVKSIGQGVFAQCYNLTDVTIPASVKSIGESAFADCCSLAGITIPAGVTAIGGHAFADCSGLKSIGIPSSVNSIEAYTFQNCSSLTDVTIPAGVKSIGDYAFSGCSSLKSIEIPSGVTGIGGYAFFGCSSLTKVTIPASVKSIGEAAFDGCSLGKVYYSGSESQWNKLNISLSGATIYYNCVGDTSPTPTPSPTPSPSPTSASVSASASSSSATSSSAVSPTPSPSATPVPTPLVTPQSGGLGSKPSVQDIINVGDEEKIVLPRDTEYLDEYETRYVKSEKGTAIYVYYNFTDGRRPFYAYDGDPVTVLARRSDYSCVLFKDGAGTVRAGWVWSTYLV